MKETWITVDAAQSKGKRHRLILLAAAVSMLLVGTVGIVLSQPGPGVLHTEQYVAPPDVIKQKWLNAINAVPGVERFRILESAWQPGLPQDPPAAVVTLFPDVSFLAVTQRQRVIGPQRFGWYGRIPSDPNGSIHFFWRSGGVYGAASYQGTYYRLMRLDPGVFAVMEFEEPPVVHDGGAP